MAETLQVRFSFLADEMLGPVTDYDVAMAYDFFLGRPPENSAAINSHKQRRFDNMIQEFIRSGEFTAASYQNLIAGHAVSRPDNTRSPSRQQISWITKKMIMTEEERIALYAAESWEELFNKLLISEGAKTTSTHSENEVEPAHNIIVESVTNNDHTILALIKNIEVLLSEVKSIIQNR